MKDTDFGLNGLLTVSHSSTGDRFTGEEVYNLYPPYPASTVPQAIDGTQRLNYDSAVSSSGNITNFSSQSMALMPPDLSGPDNTFEASRKYQTIQPTTHGIEGYLSHSAGSISSHGVPLNFTQGDSNSQELLQQQQHQNYIKRLDNKISSQPLIDGLLSGTANYISGSSYYGNLNSMGSADTISTSGQYFSYQNDNIRDPSSTYGTGNRDIPVNGLYTAHSYLSNRPQAVSAGDYGHEQQIYPIDGSFSKLKQQAELFPSSSWDPHQDLNRNRIPKPLYNLGVHSHDQKGYELVNKSGQTENAQDFVSRNRNAMMGAGGKSLSLISSRDRSSFLSTFLTQTSKSPLLDQRTPYEQSLQSKNMTDLSKQMLFSSNHDYQRTSAGINQQYRDLANSPYSSVSSLNSATHNNIPLINYKNVEANVPVARKWQYNIVRGGLGGPNNRPTLDKPNVKYQPLNLKVLNASTSAINSTPWTPEEEEDGRRIIRVERLQHGASLEVHFKVLKSEPSKPVELSESEGIDWEEVSMIKFDSRSRDNSAGYFMTSVEFIEVIECLIGHKTMAHSERRKERGRIRLNLMRFWLKTPLPSRDSLKSGEHDSRVIELALKIRKYSVSKPPGFNKEVRIMPWDKLEAAMQHALEYYFAEVPIGECEE